VRVVASPGLLGLALSGYISSFCALACCRLDKTVPTNYILLFIFTVSMSLMVGHTVMRVREPVIVLEAATLTLAAVLGITWYAATTKTDFTLCGPTLYVVAVVFSVAALFMIVLGPQLHIVWAAFGVVLVSFYLVYDTQMIIGGTFSGHRRY